MRAGPYTGGAVLLPWNAIDFPTRRRLLAARPIAAERRRGQTFAMFAVAAACGFALVMLSGFGFGRVDEAWLVERSWLALPYALLLAGIVVPSAWLARRVLSAGAWFPYERALLQLDALERTPKGLVVRPFGDARHALIDRGFVELQYADGSTFRVRTNVPPDVMNVALSAAEDILARASLSDDRTQRDAIDPLTALRDDRGFSPRAGTKKVSGERASGDRSAFVSAALAIAAFAAAFPLLALRNQTSDDAAFAFARHENVREHYEAYLGSGGARHAREVNEELLPRIVLDDAKRHGAPDEIAKFLEHYPRSRFDDEARAALASTCASIADTSYVKTHTADLFADVDRFANDRPACSAQVAAFFKAQRQALRANGELEPAMRDVLVTLLDRAESTRARVPFQVVVPDEKSKDDLASRAVLASRLDTFVGGVLDVGANAGGGTRLEIGLEPIRCPPVSWRGRRAVAASFELWMDGTRQARWQRNVVDRELFDAITQKSDSPSEKEICARARRYDFSDMHPYPLEPPYDR